MIATTANTWCALAAASFADKDPGMSKTSTSALAVFLLTGALGVVSCSSVDALTTEEPLPDAGPGAESIALDGSPEEVDAQVASGTSLGGGGGSPGGGFVGSSGGAGAATTSATGAIDITPSAAAALCQQTLGERLPVETIASMRAVLPGAWVLCSGQGIFARAQAGIYINDNDRWAYMAWAGDQLVVQQGLDNEGSLEYIDTSAMNGRPTIQVKFVNEYSWTFMAAPPTISDKPRMMVMTTNVISPIVYAAVP